MLRPLLADPSVPKIGHNLKYDTVVLEQAGAPVEGISFDTMIARGLLQSNERSLGLKDVAFFELGIKMTNIEELIGKGKNQLSMAEVPVDRVAPYAAADADVSYRLAQRFEPQLREVGLWDLFSRVEMPLLPVLGRMEQAGVAIDVPFLKVMSSELAEGLERLETQIYEEVGHAFNLNSTKQLAQVLYEELKLPPQKRGQTGFSTDAETLESLRPLHPIIGMILDYRQLTKLKSTYVDALPTMINPRTGRLHTSFNQTGAATGRLSSSDPNLQNIPIRTDLGKRVRRAFVAGSPDSAAPHRRLQPGRATNSRAHHPGSEPARHLPRGQGHPRDHGVPDPRRSAGRGQVGSAPHGQDGELRRALRHERLRPGDPARALAGRGTRVHRELLCPVPDGCPVSRTDQARRGGPRLRDDAAGSAPLHSRATHAEPA